MVIIKQQIISNKRSKSYIYYCYLKKMEITLCVHLMVYILVDLLLLCLANIILHFLILFEEYNSSNRLHYNSNRNEIMHLCITL